MSAVEHRPTQNERIIEYIQKFGSITQLQALQDLGEMSMNTRMSDIKRLGYPVVSQKETVTNRFGEKIPIASYSVGEGDKQ